MVWEGLVDKELGWIPVLGGGVEFLLEFLEGMKGKSGWGFCRRQGGRSCYSRSQPVCGGVKLQWGD